MVGIWVSDVVPGALLGHIPENGSHCDGQTTSALPALERGETPPGNGDSPGCAGTRAPYGSSPLGALLTGQHRESVMLWLLQYLCPGSEFLTGMTCSYFLRCKQGISKWHPMQTWSGGVRCRFGTRCPALLLPPLCCVHGETTPGCCWPLGAHPG